MNMDQRNRPWLYGATRRDAQLYNVHCGKATCRRCERWAFDLAVQPQRRRQERWLVAVCWTVVVAAMIAMWALRVAP